MNRLSQLKKLAAGGREDIPVEMPFSAASQEALNKVDEFKMHNADMDPARKYSKLFGLIEDLHIDDDNRDYLYQELHTMHPVSEQKSKEFVTNHFGDSLSSLPPEEMKGYIQDNFKRFPTDMMREVQDVFLGLKAKDAAKDFERARIGVYAEVRNLLESRSWDGLDPSKSVDAHARSFLKIYDNDLANIAEVHNGNLSFSTGSGLTPAYVLKETNNLDSKFIYENDLMPIIREHIKPALDKGRQAAIKGEVELSKKLFDNINNLPKDTRHNVILDYAFTTNKPLEVIQGSMYSTVQRRIKNKEIKSYKDIISAWREEHNKIQNTLLKRIKSYV
jgi:hypothetical protein